MRKFLPDVSLAGISGSAIIILKLLEFFAVTSRGCHEYGLFALLVVTAVDQFNSMDFFILTRWPQLDVYP
jgi:hypothetical protein